MPAQITHFFCKFTNGYCNPFALVVMPTMRVAGLPINNANQSLGIVGLHIFSVSLQNESVKLQNYFANTPVVGVCSINCVS
jgi:hypothetical protein